MPPQRTGHRLCGSRDLYDRTRPPTPREHQLHHLPRRLHPQRSRQLQPEAQRGQRRGEPRRAQRQPELELRCRRPDRRPRGQRDCGTGSVATCLPRCSSRREFRCCWPATNSATRKKGNNNTYCQDNELSWLNWEPGERDRALLEFVKRLTRLWREEPVLHRRTFFQGRSIRGEGVPDVSWFNPEGHELTDDEWEQPMKSLAVRLAGDLIARDGRAAASRLSEIRCWWRSTRMTNRSRSSCPSPTPTTAGRFCWIPRPTIAPS